MSSINKISRSLSLASKASDGLRSDDNSCSCAFGIMFIILVLFIPGAYVLYIFGIGSNLLYSFLITIAIYLLIFIIYKYLFANKLNDINSRQHKPIDPEEHLKKEVKDKIRTIISKHINKPFLQTRKNTKIPIELLAPILKEVEIEFSVAITSHNNIIFVSDIYKRVFKKLKINYDL